MKKALSFTEECLFWVAQIPKGKLMTYQQLAERVGSPKSARAVGNALNRNPNLITVPCHRVVRSNGEVGGYAQGTAQKIALLQSEGILIQNGRVLSLAEYLWE